MLLKLSEVLEMHHVCNIVHGTPHVGQGNARFRAFFAMKCKKLVPNHPFEIMTQGNKVQCLFFTQSSEIEGVGCKDVLV